jgi:sterol desaturase/sphingolipid hydroxylase (fatty acid hydroxylase superfamily)
MWAFFVPLVLIGFDTAQILTCAVTIFTYMTWIHTQKIGKMDWLEKVMNTPSFHRVHHGRNAIYIDKNYAGMFTIWDRMFGTYQPETEPVDYGITKPINTSNPIKIGFIPFYRLFKDVIQARCWKDRFLYLVKGPGWNPEER